MRRARECQWFMERAGEVDDETELGDGGRLEVEFGTREMCPRPGGVGVFGARAKWYVGLGLGIEREGGDGRGCVWVELAIGLRIHGGGWSPSGCGRRKSESLIKY